jgi:hypothetical protein
MHLSATVFGGWLIVFRAEAHPKPFSPWQQLTAAKKRPRASSESVFRPFGPSARSP